MRITLCGSVRFAKEMVDIYRQLQGLGHSPQMLEGMFDLANGRVAAQELEGIQNEHHEHKRRHDLIRRWHDLIRKGDAILVCNFDKDGVRNYIGGNTLMEMGFAHVNGKRVFLLNPVPDGVPYVDEIRAIADEVLEGDLSRMG